MVKLLLEKGFAMVNSYDIAGRTPLYHASKLGNVDAVRWLLVYQANPGYHYYGRHSAIDVANNSLIKKLLERSKLLHICSCIISKDKYDEIWWKEGREYFLNEK
jgi:ankyrin repeat protein